MRDIGKNIRSLRMRNHMTQDELAGKLFVTRQTVSNYETGRSRPDVETVLTIAEILGVDVNEVLYGPPMPEEQKRRRRGFYTGVVVTLALGIPLVLLWKPAAYWAQHMYVTAPRLLLQLYALPFLLVCLSWTIMCGVGMLIKARPMENRWAKYGRWAVFCILTLYFVLLLPHVIWFVRCATLELYIEQMDIAHGWESSFLLKPEWYNRMVGWLWIVGGKWRSVFLLLGALLWVFGFPCRRSDGKREKQWLFALVGLCLGLVLYAAAEKDYVVTLHPDAPVDRLPFHVEIQWEEDVN